MWYIHAFVIPNGQLIFPLGCLLCFYSVNKKLCGSIKKVRLNCMDWCKNYLCRICYKQRNGQPFNLQKGEVENATAPESNRSSPPSSTFFDIPYTRCFTMVTADSQHSHLLHHRSVDIKPPQNYHTFHDKS